jgi:hypothetical protein
VVKAVPPGFHSNRRKGVAIATDIDDGSKPTYDLPAPSKAGAVVVSKDANGAAVENGDTSSESIMGKTTGWAPRFGWPTESVHGAESLLDHSTWLEGRISDKLYGGE